MNYTCVASKDIQLSPKLTYPNRNSLQSNIFDVIRINVETMCAVMWWTLCDERYLRFKREIINPQLKYINWNNWVSHKFKINSLFPLITNQIYRSENQIHICGFERPTFLMTLLTCWASTNWNSSSASVGIFAYNRHNVYHQSSLFFHCKHLIIVQLL